MRSGFWKLMRGALTGGSAALLLSVGTARAENPEVEDLRTRIERLERQNAELRQGIATPVADHATDPAAKQLNDKDVKKIVGDYIKEQDDKKKKDDAAKAAEAKEKGYDVGSDTKMTASWNNGVVFDSANKDFRVHIGGRFQDDWVWWNEPAKMKAPFPTGVGNLEDGTFFRRIRLEANGYAYEVFEFSLEMDFENITTIQFDHLWFGEKDIPILGTVRVGQHKVPQGFESYGSSKYLTFMERAAPFEAFLLEYAPGIFVGNNAFDQHLTWQGSFYRPVDLTSNRGGDVGTGANFGDGEFGATGRMTFLPYYENDGRYMLHLGGSYTYRTGLIDNTATNGTLATGSTGAETVQFRTRAEMRDSNGVATNSDNNRFIDTGLFQADNTQILGGEIFGNYGPINLRSEYFWVVAQNARTLPVAGSKALGSPCYQGFYAQASYFLTGENYGYDRRFGLVDRVKPYTNFWWVRTGDGCCHGIGAWEIAARYSLVDLNDNRSGPNFTTGSGNTAGTSGGMLSEYTAGLNWYLTSNMKVQWNYVHAVRDVNAKNANGTLQNSGSADGFGMEFQIDF